MTLRRLLILPILLMLLAACGTTATPAAPTAVPVTQGALPESVSVQDMLGGELSLNHPAGWSTRGDGEAIRVLLATNADLLTSTNAALTAGQIQMLVSATPIDLAPAGLPAGTTLSPKTFLEALLAEVKKSNPALPAATVTETTIAGNTAASTKLTGVSGMVSVESAATPAPTAAATTPTAGGEDALIIVVASNEAYITIIGVTAKGDLAAQEQLITDIAATADYVKAAE